ncbi:MAG TPA: hypothetical protein VLB82_00550 [Thermodesulfobacteriota bacterium]|nr:hypothetical protein [Thermodesulfobacteriota bacterium]
MKHNYKIILLAILSVFVLNCGTLGKLDTSSYYSKPETLLRSYTAFEITDFESYDETIPLILKTQIPGEVENQLIQSNIGFQTINYGPIDNVPASETIIMLAEIVDVQSSKDFKFDKGALKFGESSISIQIALVQKDNGREILTAEVAGFSSLGFGKSADKFKDKIANEIVEVIAANY